jgi:hypothetical protein
LIDQPQVLEGFVDQSVMRVVQPVPQQAGGAQSDDNRQEDHRPREAVQHGVGRRQQRHGVAANHQDGGDDQRVLEGVAERDPELAVVEGAGEVVGPDELRWFEQRPVVERNPGHLQDR